MDTDKPAQAEEKGTTPSAEAATSEEDTLVVEVEAEETKAPEVKPAEVKTTPVVEEEEKPTYTPKQYKGIQRVVAEKDKQIGAFKQELEDLRGRLTQIGDGTNLVLEYLQSTGQMPADEATESAKQPDPRQLLKAKQQQWNASRYRASPGQIAEMQMAQHFTAELQKNGLTPADADVVDYFSKLSGVDEAIQKLPEYLAGREQKKQSEIQKIIAPLEEKIKKLEAEKSKELGLTAVETGASGGTITGDDAEFLKKMGDPKYDPTLKDYERNKKILRKMTSGG